MERFSKDEAGCQLWILRHPLGIVLPEEANVITLRVRGRTSASVSRES